MALTTIRQEQGVVINEGSTDVDFRVESNGNANMLFVDGGNDRVGVGTSSPDNKVNIQESALSGRSASNGNTSMTLEHATDTGIQFFSATQTQLRFGDASSTGAGSIIYAHSDDSMRLSTNASEAMRIDSSGNLLVAKTASDLTTVGIVLHSSGYISTTASGGKAAYFNRTGADGDVVSILNDGTAVGSISVDGSATAYNTSSDYRLKENVDYSWDATTRLKQLKPARFNFISDDTNTLVDGFIAHEVSSIVPEAITGEKDAVDSDGNPEYQGIDHSKLVPLLVKTIQELEARITALE